MVYCILNINILQYNKGEQNNSNETNVNMYHDVIQLKETQILRNKEEIKVHKTNGRCAVLKASVI
jgi:hypothetical protein